MNRKSVLALLSLLVVSGLVLAACDLTPQTETPQTTPQPTTGKILEAVKARGKVVCGIHTSLPGFGYLDSNGRNMGFDIDLCRAVAVALFNSPDAVEFVPLTAAERGPALQTGEVDMLARNCTWTSSRDAQWGNFVHIMFFDGQGMMVRKASGFTKLEDLDGATVCVTTGTTTEKNLSDAFRQRNLKFTAVTFEDTSAVYKAYEEGRCDCATSDKSQLAAVRSGFQKPDDHVILDVTMSKEPLAPAVPAGDDKWLDVVRMVMFVLINAEELGVTSQNVDQMMSSDNIEIRRLLGVEGTFGQEDLGLSKDFAANVIRKVGNYGEIYDRYMGPSGVSFTMDRGLNNLWTNGGLMYAPPLR
ncbi:MAG: amino acid ABC transporter substrate-binding protein [Chloroflexi bacterium]|nr:amino acid ABC transporter substrate-binding protein [Chloroflexota bacterium]MBU1751310.1 amino acid ABC transporter substrate-binding protein [Chloroflexota bacterium]MBU1877627.1 amino acid ABC transporter substrate-binding protein [Chloroflexota bacterium]